MEKIKMNRSDEYIMEAFVELLAVKDYEKISITDITNKAGVARVTFYRHFSGIDDIFETIFDRVGDSLIMSLLPALKTNNYEDWYVFIKSFLQDFYNHRNDMKKITRHNSSVLFRKIHEMYELQWKKRSTNITDYKQKLEFQFKLGIISIAVKEWAFSDFEKPIEEIASFTTEKVIRI